MILFGPDYSFIQYMVICILARAEAYFLIYCLGNPYGDGKEGNKIGIALDDHVLTREHSAH